MGVNPGLPGLPQSLSECRSRGLRLFDRMLDEVRSGSVSPVSRLRLLSSSFDLLNGTFGPLVPTGGVSRGALPGPHRMLRPAADLPLPLPDGLFLW